MLTRRSIRTPRTPKHLLSASALALAAVALAAPGTAGATQSSHGPSWSSHSKKADTPASDRGGRPAGAGTGRRIR
jgi:hypothetical protein